MNADYYDEIDTNTNTNTSRTTDSSVISSSRKIVDTSKDTSYSRGDDSKQSHSKSKNEYSHS